MKDKTNLIFSLFDENSINYYLLRPLNFNDDIKDIDLILDVQQYDKVKEILCKEFGQLYYKPSNANSSTQLLVDDLLLDIKFDVCFLPRKSLVLKYDIPYSKVVYKSKDLLLPNVDEEKLFTFWLHHLFLDKYQVSDSSTFEVFVDLYSKNWIHLIESQFFHDSLIIIYSSNKSDQAKQLILSFFKNGLNPNERVVNAALKKLVLRNNFSQYVKYVYDKFKFGIFRRIGLYENYRTVK